MAILSLNSGNLEARRVFLVLFCLGTFLILDLAVPTGPQEGRDSSAAPLLGAICSSNLCPHRSDHLCDRRCLGCPGGAGSHCHSPHQGPLLLCGRVWQPLPVCPQDHPEHLYRVQLTASELNPERAEHQQVLLYWLTRWTTPALDGARTGHQGLGRAWGDRCLVVILCHRAFSYSKTWS